MQKEESIMGMKFGLNNPSPRITVWAVPRQGLVTPKELHSKQARHSIQNLVCMLKRKFTRIIVVT